MIPALGYSAANYFFGDKINDSFQGTFYHYPEFVFGQGLVRAAYAQITGKAIGAISIWNLLFTPFYACREFVNYVKNRRRNKDEP